MKKFHKVHAIFILSAIVCISCGQGDDTSASGNDNCDKNSVELHKVSEDSRADKGGSGVMLQGFTWTSSDEDGTWYDTMISNAKEINNVFEYVWFPPSTDCADSNGNGYLPRELNLLTQKYTKVNPNPTDGTSKKFYGTEKQLKNAISAIKPAKAIADVVINHRCGTTDWGDFTNPDWGVVKGSDYSAICKDDEGFTNSKADMYGVKKRGSADTGDSYDSARDIDHKNLIVQDGIVTWMNDVLKEAGFVGWRYDMVKGYDGIYNGYYNAKTEAEFSVGEYWDGAVEKLEAWIKKTTEINRDIAGKPARAFDFALKYTLNNVFGEVKEDEVENKNYRLLASKKTLYKRLPGYAVTFIDNHDTGSTQKTCPLDPNDMGAAYAFILTHPGYPCVAWFHYFSAEDCPSDFQDQYLGGKIVSGTNISLKQHIKNLIALRKECGITDMSIVKIIEEKDSSYFAKIKGEKKDVLVAIGAEQKEQNNFTEKYKGRDFQIFTEK